MLCLPTFDGVDKDGIGIMVIEKENVVHITGGCEWETAWLVCGNHGIEFVKFNSGGAD